MKDFFLALNFPRLVILLSLVGSGVLGYYVHERTTRLAEVEEELGDVRALVKQIQELGIELEQYQEIAGGAGDAEFDYHSYITAIAVSDLVGIGQVRITPQPKDYSSDVEDRIYKIRLDNKAQKYHQGRIGNFLYTLEADNRRARVTSLKFMPYEKVRPGEQGEDLWTFEAEITERRKKI